MKKQEPQSLFPTHDLPPEIVAKEFQGSVEMLVQGVGRRSRRTYQRLCREGIIPSVKTKEGYAIETKTVVAVVKEEMRIAERDAPLRRAIVERLAPTPQKVLEMNERHSS